PTGIESDRRTGSRKATLVRRRVHATERCPDRHGGERTDRGLPGLGQNTAAPARYSQRPQLCLLARRHEHLRPAVGAVRIPYSRRTLRCAGLRGGDRAPHRELLLLRGPAKGRSLRHSRHYGWALTDGHRPDCARTSETTLGRTWI